MKKLWILALSVILAACVSTSPSMRNPDVAEAKQMQTQFVQANARKDEAWANYAPECKPHQLTWRFGAYQGLSVEGNYHVHVMPSTDGALSIQIAGDPNASVKGTVVGKVLALKVMPYQGGNLILRLPAQTKYLTINNAASVDGGANVQYLNVRNSSNISLSQMNWMLQYLYVNDSTQVSLKGISTPYLLARMTHAKNVTLSGKMALRELDVQDSQHVMVYWLESPILTLNVDHGSRVLLSGIAKFANVKVMGDSSLDAKYLTVRRLFVKTQDQSKAEVTAADALNALAANESNIYYYHQPALLSRYYRDNGSILYMGETPPPCRLAYCPALPNVLPG